ncbi:hypothetical protein H7X46_12770 [Pseudonocardia sp. C8]|uniref:hypothetical protein n=1 Tax=Pseudonocardia sp. C8 TaxID=2762759 RepID=UPI001642E4CE|nr:hypothetical protein [Pseudonocardia sp. C8]MBC3191937.1 hypothetical protein [Pseudonocardia sp. C8]
MDRDRTAALQFLRRHFRPDGPRLGIVVLAECGDAVEGAAAEVLREHGLSPARRLARIQPRVDEPAVSSEDLADFLERYGHEYCAAWLPVRTVAGSLDTAAVDAAGRRSGCVTGWYGR